jgi:hypothetical protein
MIRIELTEQEAQALFRLMDLGVKAGGLQVAPIATIIVQKLHAAHPPKTNGAAAPMETQPQV